MHPSGLNRARGGSPAARTTVESARPAQGAQGTPRVLKVRMRVVIVLLAFAGCGGDEDSTNREAESPPKAPAKTTEETAPEVVKAARTSPSASSSGTPQSVQQAGRHSRPQTTSSICTNPARDPCRCSSPRKVETVWWWPVSRAPNAPTCSWL